MPSAIAVDSPVSAAGTPFETRSAAVDAVLKKQLFFIVGCQKSGTTWLQHLLNGHPEISCDGESAFVPLVFDPFRQLVQAYNQRQKIGKNGQFDAGDAQYLFASMFALILSKWGNAEGIRCVGEKTPEHAVVCDILASVFPGARFLHIIRDPRDIAVSGWFHNVREKADSFHKKFATIGEYAAYIAEIHWPGFVSRARAVGQAHPDRYLELRYEDMLDNPNETTMGILRFLGADAEPSLAQMCVESGSFAKLSGGRKAGIEDRGSFFRKGVAGDWKNHLDTAAAEVFTKHLGNAMRELGYEV